MGTEYAGASLIANAADRVDSNIVYQILSRIDDKGNSIPFLLGEGRFAKVYKAWQRSDGENIRHVAIKILHNTARYVDQNLFQQEIALLKDLSVESTKNVVSVLDIVQLAPMIMCGCGKIYSPLCPICGRMPLHGRDTGDKEYPSLACPDNQCGYFVSAMNIEQQTRKLSSFPAKTCCKEGPFASAGTVINFVDRPAVIMELQDNRLVDFGEVRRQYFHARCFGSPDTATLRKPVDELKLPAPGRGARASLGSSLGHWYSMRPFSAGRRQSLAQERLHRAMALDKMMLMIQAAESVAWLHGDMGIIHKDLTPDNVMVNLLVDHTAKLQTKRQASITVDEILRDCVSYPTSTVKVIDFGLSDRMKLSRKWYEEKDIINAGMDKAPYFSPEALQRSQRLNFRLEIDEERRRFSIPPELRDSDLSVHEGDILAFQWDLNHDHDLTVIGVEHDAQTGRCYAYFEGQPPPAQQQRQFQLVLTLGEAHDVYSLGALFYFILTESHLQVKNLSGFVSVIQTRDCELTASELLRRHGETYIAYRDAIPVPDLAWRDRIMELILRAMVRGRRHSFNTSRSERGPEPAYELLWETKRIFRGYQEQILSEPSVSVLKRQVASAAMLTVAAAIAVSVVLFRDPKPAGARHADSTNLSAADGIEAPSRGMRKPGPSIPPVTDPEHRRASGPR